MRIVRRRERNRQPLRYLVYASDAKIEMLFEQIDLDTKKHISAEINVNLKIASLTLRQADDPAKTREYKLRIVEHYIDAHHQVGSIEEPGDEYFRGEMDMRWGYLADNTVYFRGSEGSYSVCLVGSRHHVIGEKTPTDIAWLPVSNLPAMHSVLALEVLRLGANRFKDMISRFPKQHFEFLAVMLEEKTQVPGVDKNAVLGTPLYVARAPNPSKVAIMS
jgi:hypothetical protein